MPNSPRSDGNVRLVNKEEFERLLGVIFASDPITFNTLLTSMPLFLWALRDGTWPSVQSLIIEAHTATLITTPQYDAIKEAALATNVPIVLP